MTTDERIEGFLITKSENRGNGAAIKTALKYIGDETDGEQFIGIMDADGQQR